MSEYIKRPRRYLHINSTRDVFIYIFFNERNASEAKIKETPLVSTPVHHPASGDDALLVSLTERISL